jgi:ankyrin repeat protein
MGANQSIATCNELVQAIATDDLHNVQKICYTTQLWDIGFESIYKVTPALYGVIHSKNEEIVNTLIDADRTAIYVIDFFGLTLLQYAMQKGMHAVIRHLFEIDSEIFDKTYNIERELFNCSVKTVECILELKPSLVYTIYGGDSLFHVACCCTYMIEFLSRFSNYDPALINWQNIYGCTPLHRVVNHAKDTQVIDLMIELGADPDIRDHNFCRPLEVALNYDDKISAKMLALTIGINKTVLRPAIYPIFYSCSEDEVLEHRYETYFAKSLLFRLLHRIGF